MMKFFGIAATVSILLISSEATAKMTNDWVESVIQGRELAQQILEQRPAENFTNTGVLIIDNGQGQHSKIPIKFDVTVTATNWSMVYKAFFANSTEILRDVHVIHPTSQSFQQLSHGMDELVEHSFPVAERSNDVRLKYRPDTSFAGSDFSEGDLCLEFLRWPRQRILKPYEMRRGRSCKVLESVNPNPTPNSYSRVVSWIDNETLGIVQAEAYDAKGKLLKEFYPKNFKKVNGQWEVGEMKMINDQTGSRSWIKFDLKRRD